MTRLRLALGSLRGPLRGATDTVLVTPLLLPPFLRHAFSSLLSSAFFQFFFLLSQFLSLTAWA